MDPVSSASLPSSDAAAAAAGCFHCGLPLDGASYPVLANGVERPTCCRGCQAVANTILGAGLAAYYEHRTAPARPGEALDALLQELGVYDLPEVQRSFVRAGELEGEREAALLLDGVTCAACVWLIERRVSQVPGVSGVNVNYATRRARVRWSERDTRLSAVLAAIAEIGYSAQPYDAVRSDLALAAERRSLLWRLFVAGFGMMQVMMYAYPAYIDDGALSQDIAQLMRLASLVLTAPVALWSAVPFYAGAWRELKSRRFGMDLPVAIGIAGAFAASVYATWRGSGHVYFDSVAMFVFLLLGARYLELAARMKAAQAQQRLVRQTPAVAERYPSYPSSGPAVRVAAASLVAGDHVLVRPGAAFPADGVIVDGEGAADESLLTGESRPVPKSRGDRVAGGAVNLHAPLAVRVDRVGEESVLAAIVRLMDRAQTEKPRIAQAADRMAQGFVAALLVVTAIATAAWAAIAPEQAPWIAVAILVITCPCALSLAAPAALTAATGALHGAGVLVTRGHALETLARATDFVFDKTGTLTAGRMKVVSTTTLGSCSADEALALAAALEARSEHPLARAFAAAAPATSVAATDFAHHPGEGIEARVEGRVTRIGRLEFVAALHGERVPPLPETLCAGTTVVALGDDRGWLALFALDDALREDARETVAALQAAGRRVHLLSGDRDDRVQALAQALGIAQARGDARPEDKVEYVRQLQRAGRVVAMTGDGVNDAPVLAQAQVSAALGGGTPLAHSSADIVLMADRLAALTCALDTAQRYDRIVRQNFAWAIAYNAVALPLAVLGQVTPLVAAAGMSLSSLTVVLNALRLLPRSPRRDRVDAAQVPKPRAAALTVAGERALS